MYFQKTTVISAFKDFVYQQPYFIVSHLCRKVFENEHALKSRLITGLNEKSNGKGVSAVMTRLLV